MGLAKDYFFAPNIRSFFAPVPTKEQQATSALGQLSLGSSVVGGNLPGQDSGKFANPSATLSQAQLGVDMGSRDFRAMHPLVQAAVKDRQSELQAAQEQRGREETGYNVMTDALSSTIGGARQRAQDYGNQMESYLQEGQQKGQANVEELQKWSRQLPKRAEARKQEDIADAQQRQEEALRNYKDSTAASISQQRDAIKSNAEDQKSQIVAQAQAAGMNPSDPAVQAQLRAVDQQSFNQLGNVATQAFMAYNESQAQLREGYDSRMSQLRSLSSSQVGEADTARLGGLEAAAKLSQLYEQATIDSRIEIERQREGIHAVADQMEVAGAQWKADFLRDMTTFYSPVGPIAAMAFQAGLMDEQERASKLQSWASIGRQIAHSVAQEKAPWENWHWTQEPPRNNPRQFDYLGPFAARAEINKRAEDAIPWWKQ